MVEIIKHCIGKGGLDLGYNISCISNLPSMSGYYFFLLGKEDYTYGQSGTALYKKFDELAERIGSDSAIVKSHKGKSFAVELEKSFQSKSWFHEMYIKCLSIEPALVIMNRHPKKFDLKDGEFLAIISFETLDAIYPTEYELIKDIINLATKDDLNILKKAEEHGKGIGLLERIKNAILLQPNFSGIGIDLKALSKSNPKHKSLILKKN